MIDRAKLLTYVTSYWWRPCKDGIVWVASESIDVGKKAKETKKAKKATEDYAGVFLWYPSKTGKFRLEALCLVPKSKEKEIEALKDDDRQWSKYSSVAIALASYKDNAKDPEENLALFTPKPPYHALNDCTHFTSECLIAGGVPISDDKARRGAGDLANYLDRSKLTKTLCYMAAHDDVQAVVDAGIVKEGDVFAYYTDLKHQYAHHTVPAVSSSTIAMHTWHAFGRPWDLGKSDERYSLFHFADDDYTTTEAKKWPGWWKVETLGDPKSAKAQYYHFDSAGTLTVTSNEPKEAKVKPKGSTYRWFSTKAKTAVIVRRNGTETKVETFTLADPKPKTPATAAGAFSNLPTGSKLTLKATKLF